MHANTHTSVLLEPIMKLEVVTPEQYVGDVTGDLNRRRGILEEIEARDGRSDSKSKSSIFRDVRICNIIKKHIIRESKFYNGIFEL